MTGAIVALWGRSNVFFRISVFLPKVFPICNARCKLIILSAETAFFALWFASKGTKIGQHNLEKDVCTKSLVRGGIQAISPMSGSVLAIYSLYCQYSVF